MSDWLDHLIGDALSGASRTRGGQVIAGVTGPVTGEFDRVTIQCQCPPGTYRDEEYVTGTGIPVRVVKFWN